MHLISSLASTNIGRTMYVSSLASNECLFCVSLDAFFETKGKRECASTASHCGNLAKLVAEIVRSRLVTAGQMLCL